jgi:hypothetical protein
MIPPDSEIYEVEQRIATRRAQLARHTREAGTRAMQGLASPWALAAAAGIGFLAASAFARKQRKPKHPERRKSDHLKAAKATGVAGLLMPVAMWLVKAQWGSPVGAAQALIEKWSGRKTAPSPRSDKFGDKRGAAIRVVRP